MKTLVLFGLCVLTANAAEFTRARASADSGGGLLVSWRETGLEPGFPYSYEATAKATANYWCIDTGTRHPTVKTTWLAMLDVKSNGSFTASKSGNVTGELPLSPPPGPTGVCKAGESLVLHDVTYGEIDLTDGTNVESIPGVYNVLLFERTIKAAKGDSIY
jgi:hypothetical protein